MFVYQPTYSALSRKQVNGKYVSTWKQKKYIVLESYFGRKLGLSFNNRVLVVEQNKYGVKIVYACIVYDFRNLAE